MSDAEQFVTVRFVFSKTGSARYISHLDLNRTMTRAVRRAGLPLWYTEGFNRHPYLTFAVPLSLGCEGERETMDIRLAPDVAPDEAARRLDAVMPDGLRVLSAAPAVQKPGTITAAEYRIAVACAPEEIARFLSQPSIPVEKRTKKKERKELDLRPILDEACSSVEADGEGCLWRLILPAGSMEAVNPMLVMGAVRAFLGQADLRYLARRLRLLTADKTEFK